jgi:hypothetical protein
MSGVNKPSNSANRPRCPAWPICCTNVCKQTWRCATYRNAPFVLGSWHLITLTIQNEQGAAGAPRRPVEPINMSFFLMAFKHVVMFLLFGGDEYAWERGVTPLSSPVWPAAGILAYLTMVIGLKALIKQPVVVPRIIPSIHNLILCIGSGIMFVGCATSVLQV